MAFSNIFFDGASIALRVLARPFAWRSRFFAETLGRRSCNLTLLLEEASLEIPDVGVEAVLGGVVVPTEEPVLGGLGDTSRVGCSGKVRPVAGGGSVPSG